MKSGILFGTDKTIWKSLIDADFIHRYCLPDKGINLTNFQFYISSECKFPLINTEKIIDSFKIHPFFVSHQWTNVQCVFDSTGFYQHLTSSLIYTPRFFVNLM